MDKEFTERAEAEAQIIYGESAMYPSDARSIRAFVKGAQFGRTITPEELEAAAKAYYLDHHGHFGDYAPPWEELAEVHKQVCRKRVRDLFRAAGFTFTDEAQP